MEQSESKPPLDYASSKMALRRPRRYRVNAIFGCFCLLAAIVCFLCMKSDSSTIFDFVGLPGDLSGPERAQQNAKVICSFLACCGMPLFGFAGVILLIYAIPDRPD